MLKITATCLVIFSLLSFPLSQPLFAQSGAGPQQAQTAAEPSPEAAPNLRKVIAENDRKYRDPSRSVDVKALEKIERQTPNRYTKTQKFLIVLAVIGAAALVFVVIKYGKTCKRFDPPGCSTSTDEICVCIEYEQNL